MLTADQQLDLHIGGMSIAICSSNDRTRWLAERKHGIGASECAALIDAHPYMSRAELYAQKLGFETREDDDLEPEHLFWGSELEGAIISGYGRRSSRQARKHGVLARHPEHAWMLCTLDAETREYAEDNWHPLEVKNVTGFKVDDWAEGVPAHHQLQAQWQMMVTGASVCTVAALIGGNRLVWDDVRRDEIAQRKLKYAAEKFLAQLATGELPPDCIDGHAGTKRALLAMHEEDDGSTVQLDADLIEVADELEQLKATEKALKERVETLNNKIREAIGDATLGVLPNYVAFSWKQQTKRSYTVAESTTRVLRRHEPKHGKKAG